MPPNLRRKDATAVSGASSSPLRPFVFENLPPSVRQTIYGYLGFPSEVTFTLSTDKTDNTEIKFLQCYDVDLNLDASLSVPWDFGSKEKTSSTRSKPRASINMMRTSKAIWAELHALLYSNSLFIVHPQHAQRDILPTLEKRCCDAITHLIITFMGTTRTQEIYNAKSLPLALAAIIDEVAPRVPNLRYFGVNLWSAHFPALFPNANNKVYTARKNLGPDDHDFRDTWFLNSCLSDFIVKHPHCESFTLLRDMQPKGKLNWKRDAKLARKSLSKEVRVCMLKLFKS